MAELENSKDLISVLWSGADILRSKMDANEYKDYLLGIVFYKYLSDSFLIKVYDLIYDEKPENLKIALEAYKEALEDSSAEELKEQIKSECHYVIEPELTYTCFADAARNNSFNREQLQKAFNNIEQSDPLFADLFTDIDLYSNRLGTGDQKQSDTISNLIKEIDKADLLNSDAEILGNAYEYLIGQFASETGKKAGEFYTPQAVSKILTRIAIAGQEDRKGLSVYDPCMGSGSLLLNAKKYAKEPNYIKYYGQELNTSTYNLARMNMFLHGIVPENQVLRNGDTLDGDWPTGEETDFNMVLMNPPYSAKWSAAAGFLQDERFSDYGVLAPKSKADYAFLLHGLYHLKSNGTMAIVLPHGVLFRGAAEGKIREKLLRSGNIYAVIGLPANLFYNTSIPTCIVVLKKHREGRDVLFIDASQKFEKGKKQNAMTDGHIDSVMKLYNERVTVDKEAYLMVHVQRDTERLHLVVMNHEHIAGGSSVYEVINQYRALADEDSRQNRRFDVTLMINGLPLIHIELKNKQHSYMDGFWQIKKYIGEGKFTGIFSAVQMFVISNGVDTRYFSAASDADLNPKFISGWLDRENNPVSDYLDFAKSVLRIPEAHEMIARYTVLDEDAKRLILLRPYQIHAIEAIRDASKTGQSGYVWHTTGSGKTLTSYKATRNLLMDIPTIDKTIFLIDRKDLDTQTTMAFQAYANNDIIDVDETDNVFDLKRKLKSDDRQVIVTTIQKLQRLITKKLGEGTSEYNKIKNLKIAFVVDDERVIIRTKLEKPSKIKGLALI